VKPKLTSKQYAAAKAPAGCPQCGGADIEGGTIKVNGLNAYQVISCQNPECQASWEDEYQLIGYINLKKPRKRKCT
jgi:hypothetical protein